MKAGRESGRKQGDTTLGSFRCRIGLMLGVVLPFSMIGVVRAFAEQAQNDHGHQGNDHPVYQRHAFDGMRHDNWQDRRDFSRGFPMTSPQISAGWFQRPYPYHLDYYKMRYGGSYAPYFGNLYGTPQVVNYPPYYGPYYGGNGGGYANGYAQPGYGGIPME